MMVKHSTYDELPREKASALLDGHRGYILDGELYLVYGGRLWRRTGQTHNPRVMALADRVGWEGDLLSVHTDGPIVQLQHRHAGIEHRIYAGDRTKYSFVTFEEVDSL